MEALRRERTTGSQIVHPRKIRGGIYCTRAVLQSQARSIAISQNPTSFSSEKGKERHCKASASSHSSYSNWNMPPGQESASDGEWPLKQWGCCSRWKQSSRGIHINFASSMSYHNQCFKFHYFPHHEMISMMSFGYEEYEVTVESTDIYANPSPSAFKLKKRNMKV